jgi:hypothetical protein
MLSNSNADSLGRLEAKCLGDRRIPRYIINSLGYPELAGPAFSLNRCQFALFASRRTQDSQPPKYSKMRKDHKTSIETAAEACHYWQL